MKAKKMNCGGKAKKMASGKQVKMKKGGMVCKGMGAAVRGGKYSRSA